MEDSSEMNTLLVQSKGNAKTMCLCVSSVLLSNKIQKIPDAQSILIVVCTQKSIKENEFFPETQKCVTLHYFFKVSKDIKLKQLNKCDKI